MTIKSSDFASALLSMTIKSSDLASDFLRMTIISPDFASALLRMTKLKKVSNSLTSYAIVVETYKLYRMITIYVI